MKSIFTLFLSILISLSLYSQKLVNYEFLETVPAAGINFVISGAQAVYDVDNYKVTYNTIDAVGNEHVASGLVCIPTSEQTLTFPLACFQHGTVSSREDVPSNLAGGFLLPVAFSAYGYVVAAPDFVGLGDSPGVHPYVHAASEASAGVDLLLATKEMVNDLEVLNLNEQVFISGYSQGGHAAMALHRELELNQSDKFTVTASAPMSGPYSISDKMVDFTLSDNEYGTVGYLAWLVLGYQTAYPDLLAGIELEDVFKPEYIKDIRAFEAEEIPLFDDPQQMIIGLNTLMTDTLLSTVGSITPKNTLLDGVLDALLNDPADPLSQALKDNDTYDWAPTAPTNLYYCVGDEQVTYENAILAEEVMKTNGSSVVTAVRKDTDAAPLGHGGCVVPASLDALDFFSSFAKITSGTIEREIDEKVKAYLYDQVLTVDLSETDIREANLELYDMSGKLMMKDRVQIAISNYDLYHIESGSYVVRITTSGKLVNTTKLMKH